MASGDHDWTANEVVSAANMDDYLQLQTVQKYATSATRDTALSARKREGMVTYQDDANNLTVYSGAAWSTIGPVHGALGPFSPVVTQSGTVACTVNNSTFSRIGRQVTWRWTLTVTGSGTASNVVTLQLPYNINYVSDYAPCGHFQIYDNSATQLYMGQAVPASASTLKGYVAYSLGVGVPTFMGNGSAGFATTALAVNDIISGYCTYEAATDA